MHYTITGVDPGLVDTGIVRITFRDSREWEVAAVVVHAKDYASFEEYMQEASEAIDRMSEPLMLSGKQFVEQYRPRLKLNSDAKMLEFQTHLRRAFPRALFVSNAGIKQLITSDFMKLLEVWNFPNLPTHHQDLRSAARIALLGAIRDADAAPWVNRFARDMLGDNPQHWTKL